MQRLVNPLQSFAVPAQRHAAVAQRFAVVARRFAAIALLAVFAWLAGAPLSIAFEAPESTLPACCRAAGAHHCAMRDAPAHTHSASLTSGLCRAYPQHAVALLQPQATGAPAPSLSITLAGNAFFTAAALESYAEARRTRSPRGPPSVSSDS